MFWDWMYVLVMFLLRQYLVVVFRDKPLELWDIRTGTLLREMAKNFPTVTALVLTNLHPNKNNPKFVGASETQKNNSNWHIYFNKTHCSLLLLLIVSYSFWPLVFVWAIWKISLENFPQAQQRTVASLGWRHAHKEELCCTNLTVGL